MLRECHRILKPGGVLAGYIIHLADGLTPAQEEAALRVGPSAVGAERSPEAMAEEAGFREVRVVDRTDAFLGTCDRVVAARRSHEAALRELKGSDVFEEDQSETEEMCEAIRTGTLKRSLVVARS